MKNKLGKFPLLKIKKMRAGFPAVLQRVKNPTAVAWDTVEAWVLSPAQHRSSVAMWVSAIDWIQFLAHAMSVAIKKKKKKKEGRKRKKMK